MMSGIEGTSPYGSLESLKGRRDREALEVAAREMESLFAYELIKAMREASQELTRGLGNGFYMSLFDMELARLMAEKGLGLKEILLKGLGDGQESPSRLARERVNRGAEGSSLRLEEEASITETETSLGRRMPVNGKISSNYGIRRHPLYGDMRFHYGIDIAAPEGEAIYPIKRGRVIFSGEQNGYGNVVIIDHGDGFITKYAHNKINLVKTGDLVNTDTVIARVGNTGLSTGPHLHFEVRHNGEAIDPITLVAMKD